MTLLAILQERHQRGQRCALAGDRLLGSPKHDRRYVQRYAGVANVNVSNNRLDRVAKALGRRTPVLQKRLPFSFVGGKKSHVELLKKGKES